MHTTGRPDEAVEGFTPEIRRVVETEIPSLVFGPA